MTEKAKKSRKKPIIIGIIAVLVVAGGILGYIQYGNPYAIAIDENNVLLVSSKSAGNDVIKQVIADYKAEDSKIKKITIDSDLDVKKVNFWENKDGLKHMSKKKAVEYIESENSTENPLFTATVVSTTKGEEEYTPETVYEKDPEMIVGTERVETEGESGTRYVTKSITTVNGEVTKEKELKSKIIDEGTAEVIYKGTLGLPEGEDWMTYDGDPVFSGEDDLVTLALKYQGAPYKYGGYDIKTGVDCVQYVRYVYRKYGINLPDGHKGLRKSGVAVSYKNMRKGDIICYTGHVAIYIGNGKIAHATSGKGVHVSKVYKGQKIVTIRRIVK